MRFIRVEVVTVKRVAFQEIDNDGNVVSYRSSSGSPIELPDNTETRPCNGGLLESPAWSTDDPPPEGSWLAKAVSEQLAAVGG